MRSSSCSVVICMFHFAFRDSGFYSGGLVVPACLCGKGGRNDRLSDLGRCFGRQIV